MMHRELMRRHVRKNNNKEWQENDKLRVKLKRISIASISGIESNDKKQSCNFFMINSSFPSASQ